MKHLKLFFTVLLAGLLTSLTAQDLDEILASHAEVMGFVNLAAVKSIVIKGKNHFGERSTDYTLYIQKPNQMRNEMDIMGRQIITVVDGDSGWSTNFRDGGYSDLEGRRLEQMSQRIDFGSILFNWEEKGLDVSLEGIEDFEGTDVFKIKVINPDTTESFVFLDTDSYVLLKQTVTRQFQGNEVVMSTVFGNYQMIDGIAVAFNVESMAEGDSGGQGRGFRGMRGGGNQVIESIEFNVDIDPEIFKKPSN